MDLLKALFPHAFRSKEVRPFVIALIIYALIDIVCGAIIGLLVGIPIIGVLFSILGSLVGIYATAGIVLSILNFVKVLK